MDEPVKIDATVPVAPISVAHGEGQPVSVTEHVTLSEPEPQIPAEVAGHMTAVANPQVPDLTKAAGTGIVHSGETKVLNLKSVLTDEEETAALKGDKSNSVFGLAMLWEKVRKMLGLSKQKPLQEEGAA